MVRGDAVAPPAPRGRGADGRRMSERPAWPLATVRGELGEGPYVPGTGQRPARTGSRRTPSTSMSRWARWCSRWPTASSPTRWASATPARAGGSPGCACTLWPTTARPGSTRTSRRWPSRRASVWSGAGPWGERVGARRGPPAPGLRARRPARRAGGAPGRLGRRVAAEAVEEQAAALGGDVALVAAQAAAAVKHAPLVEDEHLARAHVHADRRLGHAVGERAQRGERLRVLRRPSSLPVYRSGKRARSSSTGNGLTSSPMFSRSTTRPSAKTGRRSWSRCVLGELVDHARRRRRGWRRRPAGRAGRSRGRRSRAAGRR